MLSQEEARSKVKTALSPFGKLLRALGVIRVYDNGDGVSAVFRWWHPLSWLAWIVFLPVCGIVGERVNETVPFRVNKWFRDHPERLQWL